MTSIERMWKYTTDVETEKILTNKYVKQAVQRFRKDLERQGTEEFPYVFRPEIGDRIIQFGELLKQTNDDFAGKPLVLMEWQCWVYHQIYSWVHKDTGLRRFRKAFIFTTRKSGKSTLVAVSALWDIISTNGAQVCLGATTRDQAKIVFNVCSSMIDQNEILDRRLKQYKSTSTIINEKNYGFIRALSSESKKTGDGLNCSLAILDECAASDYGIAKILESGMGSRPEPLEILITSGSDNHESMGKQEYDRSIKILDGVIEDDSYFTILYCLDTEDDWHDESLYQKACPSLGVTVSPEFLHKLKIQAEQVPSLQTEFLSKNLGLFVSNESAWISHELWQVSIDNDKKYKFDKDKPYYANIGVDLSKSNDLTVATLCVYQDGIYFMKHLLYFPKDSLSDRVKTETELWNNWFRSGVVKGLPGKTIDYDYMFNDIKALSEQFVIEEILYDPYNSNKLVNELENSFTIVPIPQNLKSLSPMTKAYQTEILNGHIVDSNPFQNWAMSNAMIYTDPNNNIKVVKNANVGKNTKNMHIDPVITSLMCCGRIKSLLDNGEIDLRTKEQIAEDTKSFLSKLSF